MDEIRPPKNKSCKKGYKPKKPGQYRKKPKKQVITPKASADPMLKEVFDRIGTPEKKPFTPDPFQLEAIACIRESDCLVTAPTGAGKTWIAEKAIQNNLGNGLKSWYASPLKALSNSKYAEFSEIFGHEQVGILTGDRKENPDAPVIVGTTEILRNQLYDAMYMGEDLATDLVILDEAHFMSDPERGVVWEEIMIYLPSRIPLLLLSATIGNADEIADWLSDIRSKTCRVVEENQRPVPLYPIFFHPSGKLHPLVANLDTGGKSRMPKKVADFVFAKNPPAMTFGRQLPPLGKILKILKKFRLTPAIFFLKSRSDCDYALTLCRENRLEDPERKEELETRIYEISEKSPHIGDHRQMDTLREHGVAAHHSGQLPLWKLVIETLMTEGLLDAVFATSTVAAGVNFPARSVVFVNSDKFNGVEFLPLSPTEFHQMTGRAGRRGKDNIGFAVFLPGKFMDIELMARLVKSQPSDVESQIRINFSMTLNLLLSHTPKQIEELLSRSFATFQMLSGKKHVKGGVMSTKAHKLLWEDFLRHLDFLKETGYVTNDYCLTEDGKWASQLRVDQPVLIAEGFRLNVFPDRNPQLLAGVMAAFVNEQEFKDRFEQDRRFRKLFKTMLGVRDGLRPFAHLMMERGFEPRHLFFKPAAAVYAWAGGEPWENILEISDLAEGNLAMLILRTADNLRHIRGLTGIFPHAAATASEAIELILRDPVTAPLETALYADASEDSEE